LNHNPKQVYKCGIGDCQRTFVRLDLCNRHKERHTAKGSALNRKDMLGQVSPIADTRPPFAQAGSASPELNRPNTGYNKGGRALTMPYHSPKDPMGSPYARMTNTPPAGYPNGGHPNGVDYMHQDPNYHHMSGQRPPHPSPGPQRPSVQTNVTPYGVLSPISTQPGYHSQPANTPQSSATMPFVPQSFPPFTLPPSDFNAPTSATAGREEQSPYVPSTSAEYTDHHPQTGEMIMLDQMSMQQTMPVFGSESVLNKSPYVGMPEDFMAYLFNTAQGEGSPMTGVPIQGYK